MSGTIAHSRNKAAEAVRSRTGAAVEIEIKTADGESVTIEKGLDHVKISPQKYPGGHITLKVAGENPSRVAADIAEHCARQTLNNFLRSFDEESARLVTYTVPGRRPCSKGDLEFRAIDDSHCDPVEVRSHGMPTTTTVYTERGLNSQIRDFTSTDNTLSLVIQGGDVGNMSVFALAGFNGAIDATLAKMSGIITNERNIEQFGEREKRPSGISSAQNLSKELKISICRPGGDELLVMSSRTHGLSEDFLRKAFNIPPEQPWNSIDEGTRRGIQSFVSAVVTYHLGKLSSDWRSELSRQLRKKFSRTDTGELVCEEANPADVLDQLRHFEKMALMRQRLRVIRGEFKRYLKNESSKGPSEKLLSRKSVLQEYRGWLISRLEQAHKGRSPDFVSAAKNLNKKNDIKGLTAEVQHLLLGLAESDNEYAKDYGKKAEIKELLIERYFHSCEENEDRIQTFGGYLTDWLNWSLNVPESLKRDKKYLKFVANPEDPFAIDTISELLFEQGYRPITELTPEQELDRFVSKMRLMDLTFDAVEVSTKGPVQPLWLAQNVATIEYGLSLRKNSENLSSTKWIDFKEGRHKPDHNLKVREAEQVTIARAEDLDQEYQKTVSRILALGDNPSLFELNYLRADQAKRSALDYSMPGGTLRYGAIESTQISRLLTPPPTNELYGYELDIGIRLLNNAPTVGHIRADRIIHDALEKELKKLAKQGIELTYRFNGGGNVLLATQKIEPDEMKQICLRITRKIVADPGVKKILSEIFLEAFEQNVLDHYLESVMNSSPQIYDRLEHDPRSAKRILDVEENGTGDRLFRVNREKQAGESDGVVFTSSNHYLFPVRMTEITIPWKKVEGQTFRGLHHFIMTRGKPL